LGQRPKVFYFTNIGDDMTEIIFATKNKGKIAEINEIMKDTKYKVICMEDAGITIDVIEDGLTYEENAMKKAVEIMQASGKPVLSDDSGIEIDFLDKKPGIYSSTFLGGNAVYKERNQKILEMLKDAKGQQRTARYVSVIALASPNGDKITTRATLEGHISHEIKGTNGFAYDSIFYLKEFNKTVAELSIEEKNKISHRSKALYQMKDLIKN